MNTSSMRSVGSKGFSFKIELMKWSNRMDLLAFSNEKGILFWGVAIKLYVILLFRIGLGGYTKFCDVIHYL